ISGRLGMQQIWEYYALLTLAGLPPAVAARMNKRSDKRRIRPINNQLAALGWLKKRETFVQLIMIIAAIVILFPRPVQKLRLTFLDVGQGDGIVIENGGFTALADGGSSSVNDIWGNRIERTLKCYGISELDYVFLSHGDMDHINGIEQMLEEYEQNDWGRNIGGITLKNLVLPDTGAGDDKLEHVKELAQRQNIKIWTASAGAMIRAEEAGRKRTGGTELEITVLAPQKKRITEDANENSMVLRLNYGTFSTLLTGDLEGQGEEALLQQAEPAPVTVLKVAHHGSKNATTEEFLRKFPAGYAVISCGRDNRYGHPAGETLQRLEAAGCVIYNTAENGAVVIRADGAGEVRVQSAVYSVPGQ
ncbi:MAG: MBL fold metallo-hydrolase, partial [Lachnospiraceae bacterium]|nr:MBL fold metallo-hydrolase [Lachnospiraceae bacterium]